MTERYIVDANVLIRGAFETGEHVAATTFLQTRPTLIAPDILIPECVNAAWKAVSGGAYSEEEARVGLERLMAVPVDIHESAPLARTALEIALRMGHPAYDCLYLALAIAERCRLVTADRRLFERAQAAGLGDLVMWLGDTV